jgi:hypothetical protein
VATSSTDLLGADAHDATGFANQAGAFASQGYSFVAQYIDQSSDANTAGSPSLTLAQAQQETGAGLKIMSIFQTNGMSSSTGTAYQTYFTPAQGVSDAHEAVQSAEAVGQPAGSAIYFAMDFDPAAYGAAGSEAQLLGNVQTYLTAAAPILQAAGYSVGVYGAGDTLAATIHNTPGTANYNPAYTPVAQYGWLTQSYGWAGSNPQTDVNAQGWNVYQGMQTTANGVAIDPDTAKTGSFGQWSGGTGCFVSGTLIRTSTGDRTVESLAAGDLVLTAAGEARPIKWLGHRQVDCSRHPRREEALPIRIAAGAFGPNRPDHDLLVSPGHAVCVDVLGDVLIPAGALVNGATVRQEEVDSVTYWHVELDTHDLLIANGLAAESYLEVGNRAFFSEHDTVALDASPDAPVPAGQTSCRPLFLDGEPLVDAVRERMCGTARQLGWTTTEPDTADLHLIVDGRRLDADWSGLNARFVVPATARAISLVSQTSVPRNTGVNDDGRRLGACIRALSVIDGLGTSRTIAADDAALHVGFHEIEPGPHRWTTGRAELPEALWADCHGSFFLRVELAMRAMPRWVAPTCSEGPRRDPAARPEAV